MNELEIKRLSKVKPFPSAQPLHRLKQHQRHPHTLALPDTNFARQPIHRRMSITRRKRIRVDRSGTSYSPLPAPPRLGEDCRFHRDSVGHLVPEQ
jgi:hypothetical protein